MRFSEAFLITLTLHAFNLVKQPLFIKQVEEKLDERNASRYLGKYGFVRPKYLRKFAFDKMIELEVPESVADFIEGRVPKRIGAKHYMALARQASKQVLPKICRVH